MASAIQPTCEICSECGAFLSPSLRHCPACQTDAGAPNVRCSRSEENLTALNSRFTEAQDRAIRNGCSIEFAALKNAIIDKSGVVVTMLIETALKLIDDPNSLYSNYERLVGGGVRTPALPENDQQRCAVAGQLFGSYASSIFYGVLSLTNQGLPTYGDVYCRIRPVTIKNRTSFLETNSYNFVRVNGDKSPVGYMACWEKRHFLVMAKLADRLSLGQTESDWQSILVESDGQNRQNDGFVEAHIFESFNRDSIESFEQVPGKKLRQVKKLQMDILLSEFSESKRSTG